MRTSLQMQLDLNILKFHMYFSKKSENCNNFEGGEFEKSYIVDHHLLSYAHQLSVV